MAQRGGIPERSPCTCKINADVFEARWARRAHARQQNFRAAFAPCNMAFQSAGLDFPHPTKYSSLLMSSRAPTGGDQFHTLFLVDLQHQAKNHTTVFSPKCQGDELMTTKAPQKRRCPAHTARLPLVSTKEVKPSAAVIDVGEGADRGARAITAKACRKTKRFSNLGWM